MNAQNSQIARQRFLRRVVAVAFVVQAIIIGLQVNRDVLSGKPIFDVVGGAIIRGVELILKADRTKKRLNQRREKG
jgi:hypothetical protein